MQDNLFSQVDSLSSSSQESPDLGYHSGLSKDFQSQNQSTNGGYQLFQSTPQDNLKVMKKNQRSRQRELKCSDVTRCHNHFHQSTVVVNYLISPKGMYYRSRERIFISIKFGETNSHGLGK